MLQPLRSNARRSRVARGGVIPAPTGGWDAVSPLADMDPSRAVMLDNWFPRPGYVELRKGHVEHANCSTTADVETLMPYDSGSSQKLFAAAGTSIYDVTAGGASSAVVTGLNSAQFRYVNFATSGGRFLWICNGIDAPRHYDGTTWATPSITGITPGNIRHVVAHKQRLWFTQNNSLTAAYLAVDSIAGAASTFALGTLFTKGGRLIQIEPWTIDGGDGPDDYLVFLTSRGQVAVYQGTDPGSASTWSLVGVYNLGSPIGDRPMTKVAGDVVVITLDGVVPLSKALTTERGATDRIALSANIDNAFNEAARSSSTIFGWQLLSYPKGTAAIVNIPILVGTTYHQYVMNVLTGAWCRYKGQNALCWELMNDRIFFGGIDGIVYEADRGSQDNGAAIVADMKGAFNYMGSKGLQKRWTMARALVTTDGRASPTFNLDIDYQDGVSLGALEPPQTGSAIWDSSLWDAATWPPEQVSSGEWKTVNGIGHCCAVRLRVSSGTTTDVLIRVNSFDMIFELGEFL